MSNNQAKLLLNLVKKIKSEPRDRSQVVGTLTSAKILTSKENFTSHYANLKRVVTTSE